MYCSFNVDLTGAAVEPEDMDKGDGGNQVVPRDRLDQRYRSLNQGASVCGDPLTSDSAL